MADTYTGRLNITLPANNDPNWDVLLNANFSTLDGLNGLGSLAVRPFEDGSPASLKVKISSGTMQKSDGTWQSVSATSSLTLPALTTSSVYLDDAGVVQHSGSGFPGGVSYVPLAVVVTNASVVTSITDARRYLSSAGVSVGVAIGAAVGSSTANYLLGLDASANLTQFGNTTTTKKFLSQTGTGSAANAPAFDTVAAADITSGTIAVARLPVMGASGSGHAAGIVPDPGSAAATTHYLREDGTWAIPPGSGTSPAGSNHQIQYNNSGAFGAVSGFEFDSATGVFLIALTNSVAHVGNGSGTASVYIDAPIASCLLQIGASGTTYNIAGYTDGISASGIQFLTGGRPALTLVDNTVAAELAFFSGTPSGRNTITGSKGGNVALANLLTDLDSKGLLVDGTT